MKTLMLIGLMTISMESLAKFNELPFKEPVTLGKVSMKLMKPTTLLTNYKGFNLEGKKPIERKIAVVK